MCLQKTLIGTGLLLSELKNRLKAIQAKSVLFVTSNNSFELLGGNRIFEECSQEFRCARFCNFGTNPKFTEAIRGLEFAKTFNFDVLMAIGGGSVIDMAKLILAFYQSEAKNYEKIATGSQPSIDPKKYFIAVPSTAGTGSESTHFAVVYLGKQKYSIAAPFLLPDEIILDGSLLKGYSATGRAESGLDALAQAIESFWSRAANEISLDYARQAIIILRRELETLVRFQDSETTRQDMLHAANLAGKAINLTKTTAPHAFSYAITNQYGIAHGHAVWCTLPAIFEIHQREAERGDMEGAEDLHVRMLELIDLLKLNPENLRKQLSQYAASLGLQCGWHHIGVTTEKERRDIASQVNVERLSNNPIALTEKHTAEIFDLTV